MKTKFKDFVEKQEILNNIKTSLKKLYSTEELFADDNYLNLLTDKTLETMDYMDEVFKELVDNPELDSLAEEFKASKESIASDIVEIMVFSTIARQSMLIDELQKLKDIS